MPQRTAKPVALTVKEEVVDDEEIIDSTIALTPPATAAAATVRDPPKSSIRQIPSKPVRGGSTVTALTKTGLADDAHSLSSAFSSPFFQAPFYPATRGRKRKVGESGESACSDDSAASPSRSSAHRPEVTIQNEPKREPGRPGRGGSTGSNIGLPGVPGAPHSSVTIPSAASIATSSSSSSSSSFSHRRSSRLKSVKKEELLDEADVEEGLRSAPGPSVRRKRGSAQGKPSPSIDAKPPRKRTKPTAVVKEEGSRSTPKKERAVGKQRPRKGQTGKSGGSDGVVEEKFIPPRLAEKAALIMQVMDKLYPDPPIPINHVDSFTLLCGVLLSAQTTDAQVNLVTQELFRVAPNPESMSKMAQDDLQQIIRSVGLAPTKAKHLIALSQQLLERFDGQVPRSFEGLQSLPGVGRKTAAVVMVQAFDTPAFPVDTHIHRLALRWGLTKNEKNASKVEEDLMVLFPRESWAKLHLQFIYFGREHCQARVHEAAACPICCWVKKTGPEAPKTLSELSCLRDYLASPTPPKKSSKNAIIYSERMLEIEQFKMKVEDR